MVGLSLAPSALWAQPGDAEGSGSQQLLFNQPSAIGVAVRVVIANGDTLTGTIRDNTQGFLTVDNIILGEVRIPIPDIREVMADFGEPASPRQPKTTEPRIPQDPSEPAPQPEEQRLTPVPDPAGPDRSRPDPPAETPKPPVVAKDPVPKKKAKWKSEISFGLVGVQGNADRLNVDVAFKTRRDADDGTFNFNSRYIYNTVEGDRVTNRLTLNARNDWKFEDKDFTLFLRTSGEVNEFAAFDFRAAGNAGVGYRWLTKAEDDAELSTRVGAGVRRDFGIEDAEYVTELTIAADYRKDLNERQRLNISGEIFPEVSDFSEFRSVVATNWEYKLDKETNTTLRLGVRYEYDTTAATFEENELTYTARLVLGF
ncbi:MAG: DUF481 domain-containing protein [Planctomycetota bacterium]